MMRGLSKVEIENAISQMAADSAEARPGTMSGDFGIIDVAGRVSEAGYHSFETAPGSAMVAVDGGSATILDGGSFVIACMRVGKAHYRDRQRIESGEPEMHLLNLSAGSLEDAYSIFFSKAVGSDAPDSPRGLEEAVGRIRALMEWKQVESVLKEDLAPGTVVAFDGALWAGIKGIGELIARIVGTARSQGIILCGISKRSMLTQNSRPLIPAIQITGQSAFPDSLWHYPIEYRSDRLFGDIHVAKLHPRSGYAFRIDISLPDGISPETAFGKLAYHSNDPAYAGYPYPLAKAHNDVAFSRSEIEDLRSMLRAEALRKGMDPGEWHLIFQDFHDVLDKGR